ncbi:SRPBCC family protein [Micromonospora sp. NPDC005710]|uniref:SRPBCC family protein n=1 Tax=Micromonospora sp. NPDC005710 TaxID=3157051 RepID=UPI0033CBA031
MTFQLGLDITAPAAQVFDFVADFTTMPNWYSAVRRVERVGGNGGLGTRYHVYRDLPGGPARNDVSITTYSHGEEVIFTSLSGPTPFTYRYLVRPEQATTKLILEGTISASGLTGPAALLGPLAERLFKSGMRDNLGTLKQLLEKPTAPRHDSPEGRRRR